jgi:plastocyanin
MKTNIYKVLPLIIILGLLIHAQTFAVKHVVHVGNNFFNPTSLNVSVGDTIRWQWDAGNHTTTSGTIPSGAASWDEIINSSNLNYEYRVTVSGVYNYVCTPHAAMGMVASFTAAGAAPTLSVTPSNRNVTASAGTTSFSINSNSNWNVTCNASWCTVPSSGTGSATLDVDFTANSSLVQRVANIVVTVSGLPSQTVTVTQAGAAATLAVSPPSQNVSQVAGIANFNVTSNTVWTAMSDASWCTVTPSGNGNGTLAATYSANSVTSARTATISISVTGLPVQTVTVVQAASTVGMNETELQMVNIHPNPSKGQFRVAFSKSTENIEVTILDISGKIITTTTAVNAGEMNFDLSSATRGYYFVRIKTDTGTTVKRIVIV